MNRVIILFILYFALPGSASATNYYVDTTGNDGNNGLSISTPWKTIIKLNSAMASLLPGDTVFFKRGQRFYGTLTITISGSVANPIIFDAYGTGRAPEITGFYTLTGWTTVPGYTNVWQANVPGARPSVSMLTRNKAIQPLGRWPNYNTLNGGYRTIASCTSNTSLTDVANFPLSFVGGEAVTRSERWILDRGNITAQSGKTLTITPEGSSYSFIASFGYFIQNHINCLDQSGEWAYDTTAKKIYLYSTTNPNSDVIEISMLDETVHSIDNITWFTHNNYKIRNLSFTGSNKIAMSIWLGSNVAFENDSIYNHGFDGMNFFQCNNFRIRNCFFNHIDNNGIRIEQSYNDSIENNIIKNIATTPGKGGSGDVNYLAIRVVNTLGSSYSDISYNTLDSMGECGINFGNMDMSVSYNVVSNATMVLDDNAAIYSIGTGSGSNCRLFNNVCFNNIGCIFGSNVVQSQSKAAGIYLDQGTAGVIVHDNVCYNNTWGMILNNSTTHSISNNTFCNNRVGIYFSSYATPFITANYFKYNSIFTKDSTQLLMNFNTPSFASTSGIGSLDSNYYGRPLKNTSFISVSEASPVYSSTLGLPAFISRYGFDAHTYLSSATYANVLIDTVMFLYVNATISPTTVTLPYGTFMDAKGSTTYGSFILQPFTSRIMLKISNVILALTLPEFNAGASGCNAAIFWKTANETNISGFELEQSTDSYHFSGIAHINAKGGLGENEYRLNVNQGSNLAYYRLKIINKDGLFDYSIIQQVRTACNAGDNYLHILPNPSPGSTTYLDFNSSRSGKALLRLATEAGTGMSDQIINVNQGNNTVPLNTRFLPKGLYLVTLVLPGQDNGWLSKKLIIQ